jgi:hypothetical protein
MILHGKFLVNTSVAFLLLVSFLQSGRIHERRPTSMQDLRKSLTGPAKLGRSGKEKKNSGELSYKWRRCRAFHLPGMSMRECEQKTVGERGG